MQHNTYWYAAAAAADTFIQIFVRLEIPTGAYTTCRTILLYENVNIPPVSLLLVRYEKCRPTQNLAKIRENQNHERIPDTFVPISVPEFHPGNDHLDTSGAADRLSLTQVLFQLHGTLPHSLLFRNRRVSAEEKKCFGLYLVV